ncbi:MAG TPA: TIGR03792 family protein [Ilumatobacter sp.]|nr:TIGR03792 family protein [Ilumatobacter sp.]
MVIEFLTFTVPVEALETWLAIEARHWTRFLERQTGFVRKEMWRSRDNPTQVHAVIWWDSVDDWTSIPQTELDQVAAAMGVHERSASCVSFDLVGPA